MDPIEFEVQYAKRRVEELEQRLQAVTNQHAEVDKTRQAAIDLEARVRGVVIDIQGELQKARGHFDALVKEIPTDTPSGPDANPADAGVGADENASDSAQPSGEAADAPGTTSDSSENTQEPTPIR